MPRSALMPITCLLALATGVTLLYMAAMVRAPVHGGPSSAAPDPIHRANTALVRRFYDVINTTLQTGDPAPLAALVTAGFVERGDGASVAPLDVGSEQAWRALRASFPDMWLTVEEVQAWEDWVLARVRVDGLERGTFLEIPISVKPASNDRLELFRVAGDRIAERWADGVWPMAPHTMARAPLSRAPGAAFVRMGRLTFAPGAAQPRSPAIGPVLVAIERGSLSAQVEGKVVLSRAGEAGASAAPAGGQILLEAGDALLLPMSARYSLRNDGQNAATVLTLALLPWSEGAAKDGQYRWPEATLPNVRAQLLVEGAIAAPREGPATIALGRVTVATGAELAADGDSAPRIAVVEAGALLVDVSSEPGMTLAPGQATLFESDSNPTFHNAGDGPLVLLLVTITPVRS